MFCEWFIWNQKLKFWFSFARNILCCIFFLLCASNITFLGNPVLIFHLCVFWKWFFPKNRASSSSAWCGFAWVSSCCGWARGDMQSPTWSSSHLQTFTTNWRQGRSCLSSSSVKVCCWYLPRSMQWSCFEIDFLFARVCAAGKHLNWQAFVSPFEQHVQLSLCSWRSWKSQRWFCKITAY